MSIGEQYPELLVDILKHVELRRQLDAEQNALQLGELRLMTDNPETMFLVDALDQARSMPFQGKSLRGPSYEIVEEILSENLAAVSELVPEVTPALLLDELYMSKDTEMAFDDLSTVKKGHLRSARIHRMLQLQKLGDVQHFADTGLSPFELNAPPFRHQGDGTEFRKQQGCFNACFRMVYEGVTGARLHEPTVTRALIDTHDSHLADDETFLNVFYTEAFKGQHDQRVSIRTITGADLRTIGTISEQIKAKIPEAKIFAIVSLQSEGAYHIWHTNILLEANEKYVVCHDPRADAPEESRRIERNAFQRRWAIAHNRVHLIVAS